MDRLIEWNGPTWGDAKIYKVIDTTATVVASEPVVEMLRLMNAAKNAELEATSLAIPIWFKWK